MKKISIKKKTIIINNDLSSIKDVEKLKILLKKQILPTFNINISPNSWVLPNRVKYTSWVDSTFKYGTQKKIEQKCSDCFEEDFCPNVKADSVNLFPHQSFIKDYMQFNSPYRGILLFHGLGSGKSCCSIASAEILMNSMDVFLLLPASLETNYINEIKICGRKFYNLKQYWKFVPLSVFDKNIHEISEILKLDQIIIKNNGGLWVPENVANTEPNYKNLSDDSQKQIKEQIDNIITHRFRFIHYNGLNKKKINELIVDNKNPFDNKCIIVDEVHNLISRIVNGGIIGRALYKLLMTAENCKLILLSGTPIINYPYEISYLINLIAGFQNQYILKVNKGFDEVKIKEIIEKNEYIDIFDLDKNAEKIKITLLPYGFEYKNRSKGEIIKSSKLWSYEEVMTEFIHVMYTNKMIISKDSIVTKKYMLLPENDDEFNKYFVDLEKGKIKNDILFAKRVLGTVSYYNTFSEELFAKSEIIESVLYMSDYQFPIYEKSRTVERAKESKSKFNKKGGLFKDSNQVYRFYSRANCNFIFPEDIKRPYPSLINLKTEVDDTDESIKLDKEEEEVGNKKVEYEKAVNKALDSLVTNHNNYLHLDNIGTYSPKYKIIIERCNELNGTALVYSQFRKVEGLGILALALNANGYCELKIKKENNDWILDIPESDYKKPKYIVFTGNNEITQVLLKIYNSDVDNIPIKIREKLSDISDNGANNNIRGNIIKLLMITQSGAEGISLKNVREVHILEPYWNYIRIDQVIGRAVRTCSHVSLPKEDRNIRVYIYTLKFKKEQIEKSFTIKTLDNSITTDQHIFNIAKKKAHIINDLLLIIKKSSIDCALNGDTHSLKCFSFPVNLNEMEIVNKLDIKDELLDYQYIKNIEPSEWFGEVLITKKGNFIIKPETNEVFDYDFYQNNKKLVKIGTLKIVGNKREIILS